MYRCPRGTADGERALSTNYLLPVLHGERVGPEESFHSARKCPRTTGRYKLPAIDPGGGELPTLYSDVQRAASPGRTRTHRTVAHRNRHLAIRSVEYFHGTCGSWHDRQPGGSKVIHVSAPPGAIGRAHVAAAATVLGVVVTVVRRLVVVRTVVG